MSAHSRKWRTLDDTEVSLMKRMSANGMARDHIMSFFVRPGRKISPAVVAELDEKRPNVPPASDAEAAAYIRRRLAEASTSVPYDGFGPTSTLRVHEILQLSTEGQAVLPGFESAFVEFKSCVPNDKEGKARVAKAMVGFANREGGYIFFGVSDAGDIAGLEGSANIERFWDQIADVVGRHFMPAFRWDKAVVELDDKQIAVIYVYAADQKPIIAAHDFTASVTAGSVYFRYERSAELIRPGDLLQLLHERDRRTLATSTQSSPRRQRASKSLVRP